MKADLYMAKLMLDHIQLVKKTQGQKIDIDYLVFLDHIAYNLDDISEETKAAFPEVDWTSVDQFRTFITYEVQHFKLGDIIETVSPEILMLSHTLPLLRDKLMKRLEYTRKEYVKEN